MNAVCARYESEFRAKGYKLGAEYAAKIKNCRLTGADMKVLNRTLGYANQVLRLTGSDGLTAPSGAAIPIADIPTLLNAKLLKFWKNMHPTLKALLKSGKSTSPSINFTRMQRNALEAAFRRPRYTKAPARRRTYTKVPTRRRTKVPTRIPYKKAPRRAATPPASPPISQMFNSPGVSFRVNSPTPSSTYLNQLLAGYNSNENTRKLLNNLGKKYK